MRGTEKQIAWAEDIKAKVTEALNKAAAAAEALPETQKTMVVSRLSSWLGQVAAIDYAGDMIDALSHAAKMISGDLPHDNAVIAAAFKVSPILRF